MSWRDRDYAQTPVYGSTWRGPYASRLIGGSIVTTLIAINVAIYVGEALIPSLHVFLQGREVLTRLGAAYQHGFGELWANAVLRGQIWRLFTAQYLHAGLAHIFINMLVLHFLGRPLERMWSAKRFFCIYTMCGLAGNIFFTILASQNWINPDIPAIGASGCIYGLLGAVAVMFPHATVYIYFLFPMKIRTAAIIFGGIAFITVLSRGANYGGEACHLAGLVVGVWWALKGERWWARTEWRKPRMPGRLRTPKPARSTFTREVQERRIDAGEVDRILKKVHDVGIHGLSQAEKDYLREATERQREREANAGRVDRL